LDSKNKVVAFSPIFSEADARSAMGKAGPMSKKLAQDPKLFKAFFDFIKSVSKGNINPATPDGFMNFAAAGSATLSAGKSVGKATGMSTTTRQMTSAFSTTASVAKATMDLSNAARLTSVGGVLALVGSVSIQKTGILTSFVGAESDSDKAKCYGALMEFAGSAATTAIVGVSTGPLMFLTAASLVASAVNVGMQCKPVLDEHRRAK
jgi:hypothetical protein